MRSTILHHKNQYYIRDSPCRVTALSFPIDLFDPEHMNKCLQHDRLLLHAEPGPHSVFGILHLLCIISMDVMMWPDWLVDVIIHHLTRTLRASSMILAPVFGYVHYREETTVKRNCDTSLHVSITNLLHSLFTLQLTLYCITFLPNVWS
jgi:hypothetical protein